MRISTVAFAVAAACGGAILQTAAPRSFRVPVPAKVDSEQTHLLLLGLAAPQSKPIILRIYAAGRDTSQTYLGSTALPALSPDAAGTRSVDSLRINITAGLRSWRKLYASLDTVEIRLKAFTSGNVPFEGPWSLRSVQLVHPNQ